MPHIHLETTADLQENAHVPDMLEALVQALTGQETVDPSSVKAYHTLRSNWCVGEGHPAGFAHVTLKVLGGRPVELRRQMADAILDVLRDHFAESLAAAEVRVSVDVVEMNRETYLRA
ncbi:MAG: 5-carboxymethyl-2-hydroxymuconate Delta-isomerase [Fimbriimonas sp.]